MATNFQPDVTTDVTDSSQYIRTFAKDMAALKGAPQTKSVPAPPIAAKRNHSYQTTTPSTTTDDGVTLPQVDESLITLTKKDHEESLDLSDTATRGPSSIFEKIQQPPPAPLPKITPTAPQHHEIQQQRESILDRLKKHAPSPAENKPRPTFDTPTPVAPLPPVSKAPSQPPKPPAPPFKPTPPPPRVVRPEPVPAPAPVLKPASPPPKPQAPLPPPPKPPAPPPPAIPPAAVYVPPPVKTAYVPPPVAAPYTPPPIVSVQKQQSSFHTYSTDFTDHARTEHADTFAVLAAESDVPKPVQQPQPAKKKSVVPALIGGVVLVLLGGGIAYGAYWYTHRPNEVPVALGVSSLIRYDEKKELRGTGADLMQSLADAAAGTVVTDNILLTYITSATTTPKGVLVSTPQPGGVLLAALPLNAPDILLRNSAPESTIGVVHAGTETRAFFILRVSSYERTFAGMLAWEPTMKHDLALLYPSYPGAAVVAPAPATTTVTKIVKGKKVTQVVTLPPPIVVPPVEPTEFVDAVVANHDVRVLKDSSGHSLMLYGYRDQQTLVIARDEAAFALLIDRLNQAGQPAQ